MIRKWTGALGLAVLSLFAVSCKHAASDLFGQRTGDPATFRNAELLFDPPDYQELVKPFLLELAQFEPTIARVMMEFVEAKDTSFYKTMETCTHEGENARAFIQYPRKVLFCKFYFDETTTARDRLSVWIHELTHLVYYRSATEDDETTVRIIELEFMKVYDALKAKDLKVASARMDLIREKILEPELPSLATLSNPAKDIGAFVPVPIFKDRNDLTYPVPQAFMKPEAVLPSFVEVNMNRFWSQELITTPHGAATFNAAATIARSQPADASIRNQKAWQHGLLFPAARELLVMKSPTNAGYPLTAHTISRSLLSEQFKKFLEAGDKRMGINWIRTLYRFYNRRDADPDKKLADDAVPSCNNRACEDIVIFFVE